MAFSQGVAFFPVAHLEPVGSDTTPDPDNDGDDDRPGSMDMASWERLMATVIRADMNVGLLSVGDQIALSADHYPVPEGDTGTVDMMDAGDCYAVDMGDEIIYTPAAEGHDPQPNGLLPYNAALWESLMATVRGAS